jgi:hypothetical protein
MLPNTKKGGLWTPLRIRRNAWWAATSGAMGYCAGTRLWRWEPNWRETMQVRTIKEAPNLLRGLQAVACWKLTPDVKPELFTAGYSAFPPSPARILKKYTLDGPVEIWSVKDPR